MAVRNFLIRERDSVKGDEVERWLTEAGITYEVEYASDDKGSLPALQRRRDDGTRGTLFPWYSLDNVIRDLAPTDQ